MIALFDLTCQWELTATSKLMKTNGIHLAIVLWLRHRGKSNYNIELRDTW